MDEDLIHRSFRRVVEAKGVVDRRSGRGGQKGEDEGGPVESSLRTRTKGRERIDVQIMVSRVGVYEDGVEDTSQRESVSNAACVSLAIKLTRNVEKRTRESKNATRRRTGR